MAIAAGRRLADRLFGGLDDVKADYTQVIEHAHTVLFWLYGDRDRRDLVLI